MDVHAPSMSGPTAAKPRRHRPAAWGLLVLLALAVPTAIGAAPWILLGVGLPAAAVVRLRVRRGAVARAAVERRTAELEDTRRLFEGVFESGPTAVIRLATGAGGDPVVYASPNLERVLGIDLAAVLRSGSFEAWVHPGDIGLLRATSLRLSNGTMPNESIEYRLRQPDGGYRWVSALSITDHARTPDRQVDVYLSDVTARRERDDAIRDAQQAAEAANGAKNELLRRMSHELRTPLNAMLGFGQLLETDALTAHQWEAVDQIVHASRHLLGVIDEVLDITRIESGDLLLSPEAVHVEELVRETLELIRPLADQREVQLIAHSGGMAGRYLFADRERVKQVLLHLLSNAVKYNRRRGTVAVTCSVAGENRLRISVADTGPGIRADHLARVFAPFERLDAAQTEVEGTGIGLTLSRSLAGAMGGTLEVASAVDQGSTFWVDLPSVTVEAPPLPAEPPRRRVLCIEDNPSNLTLVKRILARRPNVEVVGSMQGGLGVELASELQPALVLLDLHLPDVAGEQVLCRLRDEPSTASIPVAILTADATVGQSQRLLAAGAAAFMSKPLDVAELLRIVDGAVMQA